MCTHVDAHVFDETSVAAAHAAAVQSAHYNAHVDAPPTTAHDNALLATIAATDSAPVAPAVAAAHAPSLPDAHASPVAESHAPPLPHTVPITDPPPVAATDSHAFVATRARSIDLAHL